MIIEGIISNVLTLINCQTALQNQSDPQIHNILGVLEKCMVSMLKINQKVAMDTQSEMPNSQQHRQKLRIWQSLLVFLPLLDPEVYTLEFIENRAQIS